MKKILPFFLAVMLVVAMVVPVSAAEGFVPNPGDTPSGPDIVPDEEPDEVPDEVPDDVPDLDGYPDPYSVWTEEKQNTFPYAMCYTDFFGDKVLIMSATRPYYETETTMLVIPPASSGTTYAKYTIFGTGWRLSSSYTEGTDILADDLHTSFNMLNDSGTSIYAYHDTGFFPIPLWMIPSQVTQGEAVVKSVGGTIITLTLCGVGLMACLMALVVFGKLSRTFRS